MSETRDWTLSKWVLSKFEGEHDDARDELAKWKEDTVRSVRSAADQQAAGELAFFGAGIAEVS